MKRKALPATTPSGAMKEFIYIANGKKDPRVCCVCLRADKAFVQELVEEFERGSGRVYCRRCHTSRVESRINFTDTELIQCQEVSPKALSLSSDEKHAWVEQHPRLVIGCWECGLDVDDFDRRKWLRRYPRPVPRPLVTKIEERIFCLDCSRRYMIDPAICGMCKAVKPMGGVRLFEPNCVSLCVKCEESVIEANAKQLRLVYTQKLFKRIDQTPRQYEGFITPLGGDWDDSSASASSDSSKSRSEQEGGGV